MAMFKFSCKCGETVVQLRQKAPKCKKCGLKMERKPEGAGSQAIERLDNGLMVKAVERLSDIETLVHEHAASDPRLRR